MSKVATYLADLVPEHRIIGDEIGGVQAYSYAQLREAYLEGQRAAELLLADCVASLAGYRREMNDHQPCDAEKAAAAYLSSQHDISRRD